VKVKEMGTTKMEQSAVVRPRGVGRLPFIDFARGVVMTWDHVVRVLF